MRQKNNTPNIGIRMASIIGGNKKSGIETGILIVLSINNKELRNKPMFRNHTHLLKSDIWCYWFRVGEYCNKVYFLEPFSLETNQHALNSGKRWMAPHVQVIHNVYECHPNTRTSLYSRSKSATAACRVSVKDSL